MPNKVAKTDLLPKKSFFATLLWVPLAASLTVSVCVWQAPCTFAQTYTDSQGRTVSKDEYDGMQLMNEGSQLLNQNKNAEATFRLERAVQLAPNVADTHYNYGIALAKMGQTEEAVKQYQEAARLNPSMPYAWMNLGASYQMLGKIEEAVQTYTEFVNRFPSNPETSKIRSLIVGLNKEIGRESSLPSSPQGSSQPPRQASQPSQPPRQNSQPSPPRQTSQNQSGGGFGNANSARPPAGFGAPQTAKIDSSQNSSPTGGGGGSSDGLSGWQGSSGGTSSGGSGSSGGASSGGFSGGGSGNASSGAGGEGLSGWQGSSGGGNSGGGNSAGGNSGNFQQSQPADNSRFNPPDESSSGQGFQQQQQPPQRNPQQNPQGYSQQNPQGYSQQNQQGYAQQNGQGYQNQQPPQGGQQPQTFTYDQHNNFQKPPSAVPHGGTPPAKKPVQVASSTPPHPGGAQQPGARPQGAPAGASGQTAGQPPAASNPPQSGAAAGAFTPNYLDLIGGARLGKWPANRMPLKVCIVPAANVNGYKPEFDQLLVKCFQDWGNAAGGKVSFKGVADQKAADILCTWTSDTNKFMNTAEAGETVVYGSKSGIQHCTIQILTVPHPMSPGVPMTEFRMRWICLHEIGHALGLGGHTRNPADIMFFSAPLAEVWKELTPRDSNTVQALYSK